MGKERIQNAQKTIDHFAETLAQITLGIEFDRVVDVLNNCRGKIITTGMGKAGLAMKKFACTLCSFGIPSCYLHPGEASHGDLGVIGEDDVLFVASTSGKTREVLEMIDQARGINYQPIIGITSHPVSPLREKANYIVDMGIIEEAGEIKLAPTTSIIVMLAITDAIALALSEEKGFTKAKFGNYHHSGYLGSVARDDNRIF